MTAGAAKPLGSSPAILRGAVAPLVRPPAAAGGLGGGRKAKGDRGSPAMNQISLDWDTVKAAYPMRPLTGALKAFMDQLGPGNTPCCVQMSHALGVAGCLIGARSNRRANSRITTP